MADLEREIDELYGLPLDEFTRARNELASRLRKDGDKDSADTVKALPKPTVSAWAINQLARSERDEIRALLAAAGKMREAQRTALEGGASDALEQATREERDTIRRLTGAARSVLSDAGRPAADSTLDRIATTLRAAAVDEEARGLLERGRLAEDVELSGFEAVAGLPAPRPGHREARPKRADLKRQVEDARRALEDARAEERELRQHAKQARRRADEAEREAAAAEAAAAKAADQVAEADQALAAAREQAK